MSTTKGTYIVHLVEGHKTKLTGSLKGYYIGLKVRYTHSPHITLNIPFLSGKYI